MKKLVLKMVFYTIAKNAAIDSKTIKTVNLKKNRGL